MKHFVSRVSRLICLFAGLALAAPAASVAQETMLQRTDAYEFWSVFVDESAPQRYCYAATVPIDTQISQPISSRGDAFLLVSSFPAANVANEISVKLGFPADPNRPPVLSIGGQEFQMFSDGSEAWLDSPTADSQVVDAMRRGSTAVLRSVSRRGTILTDTFSLIGFTASIGRVEELCS